MTTFFNSFAAASGDATTVGPPASMSVPAPPAASWSPPTTRTESLTMSGFIENPAIGSGGALQAVTFFVANNLTPVTGHLLVHDDSYQWTGRMALSGGGWDVELDTRREREQLRDWLKTSGGYTITHVGRLRRSDGGAFTAAQAIDGLNLLQTVLSFAAGRQVACLLPVGYDSHGAAVWSDWRMRLLDPWTGAQHVADLHYPSHWHELFARFGAIWDDKFRSEEVLYRSFRLYLDASYGSTLQLAVSTAQAGLELLAYTHLVEDHQMLSKTAYDKLDAHERLSDYLTQHLIDDSVPSTQAPALAAAAARVSAATAPQLVVKMRNGVIHPSRTKPKFSPDEWLEARQLSLRYLLLGILAYAAYQGTYRDPLEPNKWAGTVAKVPWNP